MHYRSKEPSTWSEYKNTNSSFSGQALANELTDNDKLIVFIACFEEYELFGQLFKPLDSIISKQ